jgi:hypothetical protein
VTSTSPYSSPIPPPPGAPEPPVAPEEKSYLGVKVGVGLFVACLVGIGIGAAARPEPEVQIETRTVTEQVEVTPPACEAAIGAAARAIKAYIAWQDTAQDVFTIAGEGIDAALNQDSYRMTELTGQLSATKDLINSQMTEAESEATEFLAEAEGCSGE